MNVLVARHTMIEIIPTADVRMAARQSVHAARYPAQSDICGCLYLRATPSRPATQGPGPTGDRSHDARAGGLGHPDPGPSPAYITWDRYLANQRRLADNQARCVAKGAPCRGAALLTGRSSADGAVIG